MSKIGIKTDDLNKLSSHVKKMRAFAIGEDALKTADYIVTPSTWDNDEKSFLFEMATLLNATQKTIQGFSGMITQKPPILNLSPQIADYCENLIAKDYGLQSLANHIADELLQVGNIGVLVDYPKVSENLTIADIEKNNIKPYAVTYPIESIIECRVSLLNGIYKLTRVRLREYKQVPKNEWEYDVKELIRVLELVDGVYVQSIYEVAKSGNYTLVERFQVLASGRPMAEIPFVLVNAVNNYNVPCNPPLLDLANLNIAHLNNSAWYERALWFCGSPMYYASGYTQETPPRIGSDTILMMSDASAKMGIVQAGSDAVGAIKLAMDTKENNMAVIGARFLQGETSANIAEATASIHRSGDNATLSTISLAIEKALTNVANWVGAFVGDTFDNNVTLSRDYLPKRLTSQELTALISAWQGGGLSIYDLYDNLVNGGIVQERKNGADEWQEEIDRAID